MHYRGEGGPPGGLRRRWTSYSTTAVEVPQRAITNTGLSMILGKSELSYEAFFDAVAPAHLQFFESLQRYYQADGVLCVYGGIDTAVLGLKEQHPDAFLWGCEDFRAPRRAATGNFT